MKTLVIVLSVAIGIVIGAGMFSHNAQAQAVAPEKVWKYEMLGHLRIGEKETWLCPAKKNLPDTATFQEAFDAMGAAGWELVAVEPENRLGVQSWYFKKPG